MRRIAILIASLLVLLVLPSSSVAAKHNNKRSNLYFDSTFRALQNKHCFSSIDQLAADIRVMLSDATEQQNQYGQILAWMELARYESVEYQMDSAFAHIITARELMEHNSSPFLEAYLHYVDGIIYYVTVQYATAYKELEEAYNGFKKMNDSLFMGKMMVNMANIYTNEGIWDKSEKLLNQAFMTCTDPFKPSVALYKADAKIRQGMTNESLTYIHEARRLMEKMGLPYEKVNIHTAFFWRSYFHILYYCCQRRNEIDSATLCFNEMTNIVNKYGSAFEKANVRLIEAELARTTGPENKAIFICRDIFQNYSSSEHIDLSMCALQTLHKTYGDLGAYADAYKTMEQYCQLQEKENEDDLKTMGLLNKYKTFVLEQELKKKQKQMIITSIGISCGAAIALCTFFFFIYTKLSRKKSRRMHKELRLAPQTRPYPAERYKRDDSKEAWNEFEKQFNQSHPNFAQAIASTNAQLTDTELKICMMLREKHSDGEIQKTLHLSESSVKSYRSRIKKKFGITNPETTIETFLENYQ